MSGEIVIESSRPNKFLWRDLWAYRQLFYCLAWRDLLVRYKQTLIGVLWAVIRPLLTLLIFTFAFGRVAKLPSNGVPYPLLVITGLLPWQFMASSLSECTNSILSSSNLISKIYFPRILVPAGSVVVAFVDFLIATCLGVGLFFWFHYTPSSQIVFLPFFVLWAIVLSFSVGLLSSALVVKYRDVRLMVPFIVQLGTYVSPVGFSSSVIPEEWKWLFYLNPAAGLIDGFRWCLLGPSFGLNLHRVGLSFLFSMTLFLIAFNYFRNTERSFADII